MSAGEINGTPFAVACSCLLSETAVVAISRIKSAISAFVIAFPRLLLQPLITEIAAAMQELFCFLRGATQILVNKPMRFKCVIEQQKRFVRFDA